MFQAVHLVRTVARSNMLCVTQGRLGGETLVTPQILTCKPGGGGDFRDISVDCQM